MKHVKTILAIVMALGLCTAAAACGSSAEPAAEDSQKEETAETAAEPNEEKTEEKTPEPAEEASETVNVGIIAWSTGMGDEAEFVKTVQTTLSEQYTDQVSDVIIMDCFGDSVMLNQMLKNYIAGSGGGRSVVLIVNDPNGFSDEELLSALTDMDAAGIPAGVDHVIDGAPESTFVYDASDASGCAAAIVENAQ